VFCTINDCHPDPGPGYPDGTPLAIRSATASQVTNKKSIRTQMKIKSISSPSQSSRSRPVQSSRQSRKAPGPSAALFLGTKVIGELRTLMRLAAPAHRAAPLSTDHPLRSF
jgi:hypothetical protein